MLLHNIPYPLDMDRSKILQVDKRRILEGEADKERSSKEESSSAADISVGMGTCQPMDTPLSMVTEGGRSDPILGRGLRDEPTDEIEGPSVEIVVPKLAEEGKGNEEDKCS